MFYLAPLSGCSLSNQCVLPNRSGIAPAWLSGCSEHISPVPDTLWAAQGAEKRHEVGPETEEASSQASPENIYNSRT